MTAMTHSEVSTRLVELHAEVLDFAARWAGGGDVWVNEPHVKCQRPILLPEPGEPADPEPIYGDCELCGACRVCRETEPQGPVHSIGWTIPTGRAFVNVCARCWPVVGHFKAGRPHLILLAGDAG